jgi:hypothetical protein
MVRYYDNAEFRLLYTVAQEELQKVKDGKARLTVDHVKIISPVDVEADDDANPAVADDYGTTFVYTEGAEVPNDVVRLRVDPSVKLISPKACLGRKKLIEVIFPEGKLLEIGIGAFAHCTALRGVLRLPNSLERIDQQAFECCKSLTKVTHREDLENIRHIAFRGCAPTLLLQRVGRRAGANTVLINLMELRRPTEEEVRTKGIVYHPKAFIMNGFQYDVGPDETLKTMFNTFCTHQRGVTLRSLKLIYRDKMVFPSNMKHKTPKQLGMVKGQENNVFVYVESNEAQIDSASVRPQVKQQRCETIQRRKRVGSASKVKKERIKKDEPAASIEDYKRLHSMILTRLHEEVQPRLSDIRTKLNALDLQRQPPKSRSICSKKCMKEVPNDQTLPGDGISGKAG